MNIVLYITDYDKRRLEGHPIASNEDAQRFAVQSIHRRALELPVSCEEHRKKIV
jgi:hypothetical protein